MSLRKASSRYGIARSTLFDRVKYIKSDQEITLQSKLGRFTKTFLPDSERQLIM